LTIAAIVLAGGAARRFGGDKLAAELEGRPLLDHALEAVRAVADPVVLVLAPGTPVPRAAEGCLVARDAVAFGGPLAGLASGLAALAALPEPGPPVAVLVGGDMPSLVPGVLSLLAETLTAQPSLGAATLEADPSSALPMAVRAAVVAPAAEALLAADRRRLRGLLSAVPSVVVPASAWRRLDPVGATLRDVDVSGDLPGGDGPSPDLSRPAPGARGR
jgi:molybdenum cofactor guanylyltransferase